MIPLLWAMLSMQQADIRTTVPLVLAPVSVADAQGKPVAGLQVEDFVVREGGKLRPHQLEVTFQPMSVMVLVQSNTGAAPALAKLSKVSSLLLPLVAGDKGNVALFTYSDNVVMRQALTRDGDAIEQAFRALKPDGGAARMIDAVEAALQILDTVNPTRRKVIIVIGETRDRASEGKLDEVLAHAVRGNVTIYPVSFSVYLTAFTTRRGEVMAKDPGGMNLVGGLGELARLGKTNAAEALARATGGERMSFARLKRLEDMVQRVGEDLHSQYLLSFTPGDGEPGYRDIRVELKDSVGRSVRSRPGYWKEGR